MAVLVIGALLCLAVDIDLFTAALFRGRVCDGTGSLFPEASAAGLVCVAGFRTGDFDPAPGAELIFVVYTGCGTAFKNCHDVYLLIFDFAVLVFTDKQNLCRKYLTSYQKHDIVLQNVGKQSRVPLSPQRT